MPYNVASDQGLSCLEQLFYNSFETVLELSWFLEQIFTDA